MRTLSLSNVVDSSPFMATSRFLTPSASLYYTCFIIRTLDDIFPYFSSSRPFKYSRTSSIAVQISVCLSLLQNNIFDTVFLPPASMFYIVEPR